MIQFVHLFQLLRKIVDLGGEKVVILSIFKKLLHRQENIIHLLMINIIEDHENTIKSKTVFNKSKFTLSLK